MSLQPQIDIKASCLWVHTSHKLAIPQVFFLLQMVSIEHASIIDQLSNQTCRSLCPILVDIRHVQVVYEEDQLFVGRRAVSFSCKFVHTAFDDFLQAE